jgi:hypothetical protein
MNYSNEHFLQEMHSVFMGRDINLPIPMYIPSEEEDAKVCTINPQDM